MRPLIVIEFFSTGMLSALGGYSYLFLFFKNAWVYFFLIHPDPAALWRSTFGDYKELTIERELALSTDFVPRKVAIKHFTMPIIYFHFMPLFHEKLV